MDRFDTPVLFLIFNRPDATRRVFEVIRKVRPRQLFIAADGPRENMPDEIELCENTRSVVQGLDWECRVNTLFRQNNLGCKRAIKSAIDWFFGQVDEGIILEDDCLPDISFFYFSEQMLLKYRNIDNIGMIAGTNFFFNKYKKDSCFFSSLLNIWGWATWKRTWIESGDYSDVKVEGIKNSIDARYKNTEYAAYLFDMLINDTKGIVQMWEIDLIKYMILNDSMIVVPFKNLISNIGYSGTHNTRLVSPFMDMPVCEINTNMFTFPENIEINKKLDRRLMDIIMWGVKKADGHKNTLESFYKKIFDSYRYRRGLLKKYFHD